MIIIPRAVIYAPQAARTAIDKTEARLAEAAADAVAVANHFSVDSEFYHAAMAKVERAQKLADFTKRLAIVDSLR
jgi:hypothetical protein